MIVFKHKFKGNNVNDCVQVQIKGNNVNGFIQVQVKETQMTKTFCPDSGE